MHVRAALQAVQQIPTAEVVDEPFNKRHFRQTFPPPLDQDVPHQKQPQRGGALSQQPVKGHILRIRDRSDQTHHDLRRDGLDLPQTRLRTQLFDNRIHQLQLVVLFQIAA